MRGFRQDGALSHGAPAVRALLKKVAPEIFMGGVWPSESPDLTVLDYHVWDGMKEFIDELSPPVKNETELRDAVFRATSAIDMDALRKAIGQLETRCELCIAADGGRFEHMLK